VNDIPNPLTLSDRIELRWVETLRAAARKTPSTAAATRLRKTLTERGAHTNQEARKLLDEAAELALVFIRESARESWRKPHPSIWKDCVAKALRAADLIEQAIRQKLATTAAAPPRRRMPPHLWDNGVRDGTEDYETDYDLFTWSGCYQGTITFRPSETPQAVVARSAEKALAEEGLDDARVAARDGVVEVLWAPDEDQKYERDLVRHALEQAAASVNLPPSVVRVKWRKPRDYEY
jgi:hypothetical protein